jgi:predicted dehydrogenase
MMKKYRVAIIGATGKGNYGHGLDTVWRKAPRAEVVAVADADPRGLAAAVSKTGAKNSYADYRTMLEKERPEIVAVAPRWLDQRHAMLTACAEFGCHVYMEKPFCRTLEEADEIVRAFEMRHLKLAIAHQTRFCPVLAMAKRLIQNGEIGDVLEARARGKEDRRGGGEDFWVLGSHLVDLNRAFFGDPIACEATVTVDGRAVTKEDVYNGAEGIGPLAGDAIDATYTFARGIKGTVSSRHDKAGNPSRFGIQVFGSKGILEMVTGYLNPGQILKDPSWSPGRSGAKWQSFTTAGIGKPEPLGPSGLEAGNIAGIANLMESIEKDRQPKCGLYDARWTVEMIAGAFESQRRKRMVSFPLENRKNPLSLLES